MRLGLERATDTETVVVVDEGRAIILEELTTAAEEGLVLTV